MHITTIGLDLAKHWFQIHGIDAAGRVAIRRRLRRPEVVEFFRRQEPCLVGIEACATAHHWARELIALGHEVKLMPPAYVKAYVKRNKNDAADAAAICEPVTRPSMRFVPVKDVDQQSVLMAAGPDGVRGSGPYQECALKKRVELFGSSRSTARPFRHHFLFTLAILRDWRPVQAACPAISLAR